MKDDKYQKPVAEDVTVGTEGLLCASGGNEDFGNKPGTYDLVGPGGDNFIFW